MNLTKKPVEYTLTLTHDELLLLEQIVFEWQSPQRDRVLHAGARPLAVGLARDIEQAGIKARGGVA